MSFEIKEISLRTIPIPCQQVLLTGTRSERVVCLLRPIMHRCNRHSRAITSPMIVLIILRINLIRIQQDTSHIIIHRGNHTMTEANATIQREEERKTTILLPLPMATATIITSLPATASNHRRCLRPQVAAFHRPLHAVRRFTTDILVGGLIRRRIAAIRMRGIILASMESRGLRRRRRCPRGMIGRRGFLALVT